MTLTHLKIFTLISVASLAVAADQWTKWLVYTKFQWGESKPIFPAFFALTYVKNQGAAFGLMNQAPQWFRDPFFVVIPVVALFVIFFMIASLSEEQKKSTIPLAMIFGGAVGNLIDRIRFGYVVDFLDFYWKTLHWPAFNVADMGIVVGVCLFFILSVQQDRQANALKTGQGIHS